MRSPSGRRTARPDITGSSATRGWPLMSAIGGLPGFSSDLPLLLLGPPEEEELRVAWVPIMGPPDRCRLGEHQAAKLLLGCFGRSDRSAQGVQYPQALDAGKASPDPSGTPKWLTDQAQVTRRIKLK